MSVDIDGDGVVEEKEMKMFERKQKAQRRMATVAIAFMVLFTSVLVVPGIVPDERLKILTDLAPTFYIGFASIVGFYFGMTAWMSSK